MARRKLIAGNSKMNGHLDHLRELHGEEHGLPAADLRSDDRPGSGDGGGDQ